MHDSWAVGPGTPGTFAKPVSPARWARDDHGMVMLTRAEVLAVRPFGPDYEALWEDVRAVADRVHLSRGADRSWAWHHLLLAAANFKAQSPVFPAPLSPVPAAAELVRGDILEVPVPGGLLSLGVKDPATWWELDECTHGIAVPRATTVLSALWPGCHVIADWRALSAAAALAGARDGWDQVPVEPQGTDPLRPEWDTYPWYRGAVLGCAAHEDLLPIQVERALYTLGDAKPGATWAAYASWLEERLASMGN
jgi:hypothetical protein